MGHVRIAGRLTQEERYGATMGRLDIPQKDGTFVTQWFSGSAVFRITAVSEDAARTVAFASTPEPVHSWELPKQLGPNRTPTRSLYESDDEERDDDSELDMSGQ
jgi:hypothetical protein